MTRPLAMLLVLSLVGCGGNGDLEAKEAKLLVLSAAAIPKSFLDEVTRAGATVSPRTMSTLPLSMFLLSVEIEDSEDLHRLPAVKPMPPVWLEASEGKVSLLGPDSLSDFEVRQEGDRATGSFRFRREGFVEGKVEFTAERAEAGWRMVEFRLPAVKEGTRLRDDGTWSFFP